MHSDLPPTRNRMAPDRAPTPFSAAELADACRPGRRSVYLVEDGDGDGVRHETRFVGADYTHAEMESRAVGPDRAPLGDPTLGRAAWSELQSHASYPADRTTIGRETISTPAGAFDGWRYTTAEAGAVTTCWFAVDLPGPPVLKIDEVDGHRVATMTLVEFDLPPA